MRYIGCEVKENMIYLRYETIWELRWLEVLDIGQAFFDDICDNLQVLEYKDSPNGETLKVDRVPNYLLHHIDAFNTERKVLTIAGHSKFLDFDIMLTLYTDSKIVDICVIPTDKTRELFTKTPTILGNFMDSLEIIGMSRESERRGMERAYFALSNIDEEHKEILDKFKSSSLYLNCSYIDKDGTFR